MNKKESIIKQYVGLARKLGKLPSRRECHKFGLSYGVVDYNFIKHSKLVEAALEFAPELKELEVPSKLVVSDVDSYRIELEKKKIKKNNKQLVESVSTLDYITQFAESVFKGRITPNKVNYDKTKIKRANVLQLSDLHFGADLKGDETGTSDFLILEESRRFAAVIKQAAEYKLQYRDNTKLVVVLNGDFIENQMHDARTGAPLAEQICRAIHYLSQGIAYLAQHYTEVQVECSTGNHDRNTARHHNRAIHQKFDSHGTVICYAVKSALSKFPNVTFNLPKMPLGSFKLFGHRYGYTHGDTVLSVGNPYVAVNVKKIEEKINRINSSLPDKEEYVVIMYGHTHLAHVIQLPNGCTLVGNGGLPPSDHFGVSMGSFETNNNQTIFEAVEGHPVGDIRFIKCGKDYDKDESLDEIIKPWESFND